MATGADGFLHFRAVYIRGKYGRPGRTIICIQVCISGTNLNLRKLSIFGSNCQFAKLLLVLWPSVPVEVWWLSGKVRSVYGVWLCWQYYKFVFEDINLSSKTQISWMKRVKNGNLRGESVKNKKVHLYDPPGLHGAWVIYFIT